jgi:hypothetical protein
MVGSDVISAHLGVRPTATDGAYRRSSVRLRDTGSVKLRRAALASLVLASVTTLTGCTAADEVGVRVLHGDALTVVNCGTWIEQVTVRDATTRRLIWSAHAVRDRSGDVPSTDAVTVGVLPGRDWIEDTHLDRGTRPKAWHITVGSPDHATIVIPDTALRPGRVFRPGVNNVQSLSAFDDVCNGVPGWVFGGALGILALTTLLGALVIVSRSHRRRGAGPPAVALAGWYADPNGVSAWRYWDGSTWTDHTA